MKKIYIFLMLSLFLCSCAAGPQPTRPTDAPAAESTNPPLTDPPATDAPTDAPTDLPTDEPTQPPSEWKILLPLRYFELDSAVHEGTAAKTEAASILLEDLSLPETPLKSYEGEPFLAPVEEALEETIGLTLDGRWKYYIHYYTPEQDEGLVSMTYWIDDVIATNRAVTLPIEGGKIHTVIYSYLNHPLDEAALLNKYEEFKNTHIQQRDNVLGEDFEIYGESTLYSYNFRTDQLSYSYNIFYIHTESGIIDNTYGTEMVIP